MSESSRYDDPLDAALRRVATDPMHRASSDPPPTGEELAAYLEGALQEPEAERVEAWLAADPENARLLLDGARLSRLEPTAAEAKRLAAVESPGWEALRDRLSDEGLMPERPPAAPHAGPRFMRGWQAIAAALLVGCGLGFWGAGLLRETSPSLQGADLVELGVAALRDGSSTDTIVVASHRSLSLLIDLGGRQASGGSCSVKLTSGDEPLQAIAELQAGGPFAGACVVSTDRPLSPGSYLLEVEYAGELVGRARIQVQAPT